MDAKEFLEILDPRLRLIISSEKLKQDKKLYDAVELLDNKLCRLEMEVANLKAKQKKHIKDHKADMVYIIAKAATTWGLMFLTILTIVNKIL